MISEEHVFTSLFLQLADDVYIANHTLKGPVIIYGGGAAKELGRGSRVFRVVRGGGGGGVIEEIVGLSFLDSARCLY